MYPGSSVHFRRRKTALSQQAQGNIQLAPFPVLLSTLIGSRFQAKSATLLILSDYSFLFAVEELCGTRYQSGSFSLINVGSGFHCLRSFFVFASLEHQHQMRSGLLLLIRYVGEEGAHPLSKVQVENHGK